LQILQDGTNPRSAPAFPNFTIISVEMWA